jgi:C_GCAxxG_C_C family probable redox protein
MQTGLLHVDREKGGIKKLNDKTFDVFKMVSEGFCCSQIMLKLALELEEKENADLLRVMGGLCNGIGESQKTCGVLSSGIGIIGLYAGKGNVKEYPENNYGSMVREFYSWFEDHFDSSECIDIVGVREFITNTRIGYPIKYGDILLESFEKIGEIIDENGYTFGNREFR